MNFRILSILAAFFAISVAAPANYPNAPRPVAGEDTSMPEAVREVAVEQKLNGQVPLDLMFVDENGRDVALKEYFGEKPVVLALVYFGCPMLCNQVLNGLTSSMRTMNFDVGKEFDVLAVSFDPKDTPAVAAEKKANYVKSYRREGTEQGWHFLTGSDESIARITDAVGFRYTWDDSLQQYAHAAAIMVLTPEGRISRYFYGIEYAPRDLRLGLVEASERKIGTAADEFLLFCYQYDPTTGKYGAVAMNLVRLGGILTVALLGGFMFVMFRRDRRIKRISTIRAS